MRLLLITTFWLSSISLSAQIDTAGKFVILEYGFPDDDDCSSIKTEIDEKWNIYHKRVAGCLVTSELVDSVRTFNDITQEKLVAKYGSDWKDRYDREISEACEEHINLLKRQNIDTIIRKGNNFSQEILTNSEFNQLKILITEDIREQKNVQPISINNLQNDSNNIIYLGFPNHFEIDLTNTHSSEFAMECVNCSIYPLKYGDSLPVTQYIIRAKRKKEATLTIHSKAEQLISHNFKVDLLPDPELFVNNVRNGRILPLKALESGLNLSIRYTDEITLRSKFEVVNWELGIKGKSVLHGFGDQIEANKLQSLEFVSGSQLQLICTVKGPDGVRRKKAAAFVLK